MGVFEYGLLRMVDLVSVDLVPVAEMDWADRVLLSGQLCDLAKSGNGSSVSCSPVSTHPPSALDEASRQQILKALDVLPHGARLHDLDSHLVLYCNGQILVSSN